MGKVIGFTYDVKTDWVLSADDPKDLNAEFDKPESIKEIARALESGGHKVVHIGNINNLLAQIDSLDVDIFFNICEGRGGRNRESQVPIILEMKGLPFMGSDALTMGMTLDKAVAKKLFAADGIPTARFFTATKDDDLKQLNTIGYPLIVKTHHEGTSKGISDSSRVENLEQLKQQVDFINKTYHQPALVEEFIAGTEFTVAVLGNDNPKAMAVVQVSMDGNADLGDRFYTYDMVCSSALQYICPAQITEELNIKMQELAVKAFQCVGCRDVGRVDFRVDKEGNPYVLEINPLPNLAKEDVFNVFPYAMGSTYEEAINQVLNNALERNGLTREAQEVK